MHAAAVHVCRILKKTFVRKLRPTGHWGAVIVLLQITISPFSLRPNKQQSQMSDGRHSCNGLHHTLKEVGEKMSNLLVAV